LGQTRSKRVAHRNKWMPQISSRTLETNCEHWKMRKQFASAWEHHEEFLHWNVIPIRMNLGRTHNAVIFHPETKGQNTTPRELRTEHQTRVSQGTTTDPGPQNSTAPGPLNGTGPGHLTNSLHIHPATLHRLGTLGHNIMDPHHRRNTMLQ
jgi:hypothetical protein